VKYSFENPIYTGMADGMAATYMLEAIRTAPNQIIVFK
jgi:GDP-D-mannose dehydratase